MMSGVPSLEATISASDHIDHLMVDWLRVRRSFYLIHQQLSYVYPGPISDLQQHLMILPPEHYGDQIRVEYRFDVSVPSATLNYQNDAFGNCEIDLAVPYVKHIIDFEAWVLVERDVQKSPHYLPASWLTDARLLMSSPLTRPDAALRQVATELRASGKHAVDLAQHINAWVYQHLSYAHERTNIRTTAAEVLTLKQGVCQDYAHLMLVLCRLCGLPARYVSGHLLGEGGTHAWVEVLFPVQDRADVAVCLPFDPTHGCQTDLSYLTIAVGRDYFDVAPTSGTFRAAYVGQLTAHKRVDLTHLDYRDGA